MLPDRTPCVRLIRLSALALLRVEGADAASFLHGQVTCDVKGMPDGVITHGALCNPKGRAIAVFRLFRHGGYCDLILRSDMAETVRTCLQRYVLRSKVALQDLREQWSVFGLLGRVDDAVLSALHLRAVPLTGGSEQAIDGAILVAVDRPSKCLLLVPSKNSDHIRNALIDAGAAASPACSDWELADIRDGIPDVTPATTGEFVPQMLNLDRLGGIAFDKGCYTGQEVVARTHYLGTIKRRMHGFRVSSAPCVQAGERLVDCTDSNSEGQIVRSAPVDDARHELLAVVTDDEARFDTFRLKSADGPALEKLDLPYLDGTRIDGTGSS